MSFAHSIICLVLGVAAIGCGLILVGLGVAPFSAGCCVALAVFVAAGLLKQWSNEQ